jgi:SAM-dependent methyltransferase
MKKRKLSTPMICPVCAKSFSPIHVFHFSTYDIFTCNYCEARFSEPLTYDNESIFSAEYLKKENSAWRDNVRIPPQELKPYLSLKNKNILDIGCATGDFLNSFKEDNQVMGLEISKAFEPLLKEREIPHKIGDLVTNLTSLPNSSFNLITLWDVFEHLEDPVSILKLIKTKLAPKGIIVIWTSNYDDWISRFAEITYRGTFGRLKAFMERSFHRSGGHNFNFTPKSLDILYQTLGLKVLDTIIADIPSHRFTRNIPYRIVIDIFHLLNKLSKKGKSVCHALTIET